MKAAFVVVATAVVVFLHGATVGATAIALVAGAAAQPTPGAGRRPHEVNKTGQEQLAQREACILSSNGQRRICQVAAASCPDATAAAGAHSCWLIRSAICDAGSSDSFVALSISMAEYVKHMLDLPVLLTLPPDTWNIAMPADVCAMHLPHARGRLA
jgi:hypothetical protein